MVLQSTALGKFPWLVHGFSTRPGGRSPAEGPRGSEKILNLGFTEWDRRENVIANRRLFQAALQAASFELVALNQFHSDVVCLVDGPPTHPSSADALATGCAQLLLGVQTADCVPILLVDPARRAVAAVHAGWRGTLARIAAKAVGRMHMQYGSRPEDLLAAIGPAIGGCCYEVGTELVTKFTSQFHDAGEWFDELRTGEEPNPLEWLNMMPPGHQPPPENVRLDLPKANRAQLLEAGLAAKNILSSNLCTACHPGLFSSFRKEGAASGRMMSVVGIR